jgi:hypothetical protein
MSGAEDDALQDTRASTSIGGHRDWIDVQGADHPLFLGNGSDDAGLAMLTTTPQPQRSSNTLATTRSAPNLGIEAVPPLAPTAAEPTSPQRLQDAGADARSVRRNTILAAWNGFTVLAKVRKWIFVLRLLVGLAQLVLGIVVLSLPSSTGISGVESDTCNPKGLFVYLILHIIRVGFSIPIDIYLGLSPHRTPSARRVGSEGQSERERSRMVGSLPLDRKLSRWSDLLGLCHCVLFIVGNYVVWTNLNCSHFPAKSRPLWITCVCMLSVTYTIIVEVMLMIFVSCQKNIARSISVANDAFDHIQLLVFFLPLLFSLLRALGLASHIPQRAIRPETGKIEQNAIDEQSKLVYFTLAKEEETEGRSSREDLERFVAGSTERILESEHNREALEIALPISRAPSIQSKAPSQRTTLSRAPTTPRRRRLGLLMGFTRRRTRQEDDDQKQGSTSRLDDGATDKDKTTTGKSKDRPKYPIYPIPAHRATCPICLCDFEELPDERASTDAEAEVNTGNEVEPLRLLNCGHVMHMSCVDQWLTTVSGRCPVCQKPLLSTDDTAEGEADNANGQA